MKKLALLVLTLGVMTVSSYAQGYFFFNNVGAYDGTVNSFLPRVGPQGASGEGLPGQAVGSPGYSVGFLYNANLGLAAMDISNNGFRLASGTQVGPQITTFASTTGDAAGGAGIYDGGNGTTTIPTDGQHILLQLVVWWSGAGGFASFDQAYASGTVNVGYSPLFDVRLAVGGDPIVGDLGGVQGFTVQPVPEPSTFALAGLGAATMLIFRRRK